MIFVSVIYHTAWFLIPAGCPIVVYWFIIVLASSSHAELSGPRGSASFFPPGLLMTAKPVLPSALNHATIAAPAGGAASVPAGNVHAVGRSRPIGPTTFTGVSPVDLLSTSAAITRPDIGPDSRTLNRDLSWLEFNARVLYQGFDERLPILERARFLAIFTSNLDEFVQKRVGYLLRAMAAGARPDGDAAPGPAEMLAMVRRTFEHLEDQQTQCFERHIRPGLAAAGIELLDHSDLSDTEKVLIDDWYRRWVFPILTPLAVDPGHRFPFISNLSSNLGVLLKEPGRDELLFARVKVPNQSGLSQWVRVPDPTGKRLEPGRGRFVPLHDVIRNNLDDLFPGMNIAEVMAFRVTRAADGGDDGTMDSDTENLLAYVEQQLKRRRFADVVRLEVGKGATSELVERVVDMFHIRAEDTDLSQGLLDFRSLFEIADLPRPDLKLKPWTPVVPRRLSHDDETIFEIIKRGDVLVHHPYESFAASAERFIAEAVSDPDVLAIKQTIYRTTRNSPFVQHMIRAAEQGKQVACLVELRARFDEGRNVRLAQALEKAGVHVAYGVVGLKTHCKAALVIRREADGLRAYAHIGTGNYHPATAALYTDLGLLTCNPALTGDVVDMFNLLTGRSKKQSYQHLLVAPATMKPGFLRLIEREAELARQHTAGKSPVGGQIIAKMNALEDKDVTEALYRASSAGVKITLFVRGFCCLRPGVPGMSENITVTSVVGRFLEHSRIFFFGSGEADQVDGQWFMGSADWMYRNLEQRVEAITPVLDKAARAKLKGIFDVLSADCRHAWDLKSDGRYVLRGVPATISKSDEDSIERLGTFEHMMREAVKGE